MVVDDKLAFHGLQDIWESENFNYNHISISRSKRIIKDFTKRFYEIWNNKNQSFIWYWFESENKNKYNEIIDLEESIIKWK